MRLFWINKKYKEKYNAEKLEKAAGAAKEAIRGAGELAAAIETRETVPSTGAGDTGLDEPGEQAAATEMGRASPPPVPAAIETGESVPSTGAGGSGPAEAARSVEPRAPLVDGLQHCLVPRHPIGYLDW
jgi:hypothetical protein